MTRFVSSFVYAQAHIRLLHTKASSPGQLKNWYGLSFCVELTRKIIFSGFHHCYNIYVFKRGSNSPIYIRNNTVIKEARRSSDTNIHNKVQRTFVMMSMLENEVHPYRKIYRSLPHFGRIEEVGRQYICNLNHTTVSFDHTSSNHTTVSFGPIGSN